LLRRRGWAVVVVVVVVVVVARRTLLIQALLRIHISALQLAWIQWLLVILGIFGSLA
jgi:hypothetical protein